MRRGKEQRVLFQLIRSVLLEEPITIEVEGLDWKYLQQLCKYQKIDNLVSYGILPLQEQKKIPEDVVCAMQKAQQKGIAREATQYFSLQEIQQKFEEEQIEHLPLKGAQLKKEYPSPDMRFLTDLDILCQKEQQGKIQTIMESLGYTLEHGGGHHDVYVRNPFMTVEIHWDCSTENRELDVLLEDIWSKCIRKEGFAFAYQMAWEEYYVYMIGHMAKHLKYGGIGIRMLLDLFVFAQKKKDSCDWKKVEAYLERGRLLKFSETMQRFLQQCMEEDESFFEGNILLEHIIGSGAYGTMENHMGARLLKEGGEKKQIRRTRIRLVLTMLFPPLEAMKELSPAVRRHSFLLPAAWIWRLVTKSIFANRKGREVLKSIVVTEQVDHMDRVCRAAGLYE